MALPPGPSHSAIRQTASWIRRPIPMLEECASRYGDFFTLRLVGVGPISVLSHPETIRTLFTLPPDRWRAGIGATILAPLVGESSLLVLDGPRHMRQRKLMLPPFHGKRMQAYATTMREETQQSIHRWPVGTPFRIHTFLQDITLQVILRCVFGVHDAGRMQALGRQLTKVLELGTSPALLLSRRVPLLSPKRRHWERELAAADRLVYEEIARRRSNGSAKPADAPENLDVLSMLLAARDESGAPMTDLEVRDELITLLVAGHETTATSLAWTIERILSHHTVYDRLKAELSSIVGSDSIADDHLGHLPYLDAVIKESLRLRPVVPMVVRQLQVPMKIHGFALPAGALVGPNIYLTQRRDDIYPQPHRFVPERFLDTKPNPYAWFPFGGSIRRCIGMAFALYEMKIVLATALLSTNLGLAPGTTDRMARRAITFAPSDGPTIVARNAPSASA